MEGLEERCRELLRQYAILALDTMVFIYYFEDNDDYLPLVKPLFELMEDGEIEGKTSILTRLEILVRPKEKGDELLVDQYKALIDSYPHLELLPVDAEITDLASTLRAKYKIRTPDAIQVATSLVGGAGALVTNDSLLKKVEETEVIVMKELLAQ